MSWTHTYKVEAIGSQSTITGTKPGNAIAGAITEIQEKCVTDVTESITLGEWTITFTIQDNILSVVVSTDESGSNETSGGAVTGLPEGGEPYQVLQRGLNGEAIWDWVRAH